MPSSSTRRPPKPYREPPPHPQRFFSIIKGRWEMPPPPKANEVRVTTRKTTRRT